MYLTRKKISRINFALAIFFSLAVALLIIMSFYFIEGRLNLTQFLILTLSIETPPKEVFIFIVGILLTYITIFFILFYYHKRQKDIGTHRALRVPNYILYPSCVILYPLNIFIIIEGLILPKNNHEINTNKEYISVLLETLASKHKSFAENRPFDTVQIKGVYNCFQGKRKWVFELEDNTLILFDPDSKTFKDVDYDFCHYTYRPIWQDVFNGLFLISAGLLTSSFYNSFF